MQMDNIKRLRSRKNNLSDYKELNNLFVEKEFFEFIESELLPSISISSEKFWTEVNQIIEKFSPCNTSLLAQRDVLQRKIDAWYASKKDNQFDMDSYINFLKEIGYIAPEVEPFKIKTQNVDDEVSKIAAPQLVVPVSNARFAINACNARWGSLYDALYGTDVISEDDGSIEVITSPETSGRLLSVSAWNAPIRPRPIRPRVVMAFSVRSGRVARHEGLRR